MIDFYTKELQTGIDNIDDQHKEIIKSFNNLVEMIRNKEDNNILTCITHIYKCMEDHFAEEESIMKKLNIWDWSHAQAHSDLLITIKAILSEESGYAEIMLSVFAYLKHHFKTFDKKLATQIVDAGM